jgi:hypothetical protein
VPGVREAAVSWSPRPFPSASYDRWLDAVSYEQEKEEVLDDDEHWREQILPLAGQDRAVAEALGICRWCGCRLGAEEHGEGCERRRSTHGMRTSDECRSSWWEKGSR